MGGKIGALQQQLETRAIRLAIDQAGLDPEEVLVLEIVGTIPDFVNAVRRIQGMEWLIEWEGEGVEPDEDFYDEGSPEKPLTNRLLMVMSNRQAVRELLALWENRNQRLPHGLNKWRALFAQLRDIRFWDERDRLEEDVIAYWQSHADDERITFEIEIWYFDNPEKNQGAYAEIEALLGELEGRSLSRALIPEIAYHGVLAELPRGAVARILRGDFPRLVLSPRVMFFRPTTVAMSPRSENAAVQEQISRPEVQGDPVIALLDGLPLQNHTLLRGRLRIDDPDDWSPTYEARDRVHGTAMASLILHGELDSNSPTLARPLYVRPILRPNPADFRVPRDESTPGDQLVIDLVHRSVRRIFEGDGGRAGRAAAPTVRIINLSVGDSNRLFDRKLSPWARLIDWLAWRYSVLFCVSAGNFGGEIRLRIPRAEFPRKSLQEKQDAVVEAMVDQHLARRLIAPGDAINAITVGGVHEDSSSYVPTADRFEPVAFGLPSPITRIGHGFRRSIKPDLLAPAGRCLFREVVGNVEPNAVIESVNFSQAPGHKAASPDPNGRGMSYVRYSRGTSNASALASRQAAMIFEVINALRGANRQALPVSHDGVLLKAALIHCAEWGQLVTPLVRARPGMVESRRQKDLVARWIGYGKISTDRTLYCTSERATAIGTGTLRDGEAQVFRFPLPPSLSGPRLYRRLTITLAWISPANNAHQAYRRARLWFRPPGEVLRVDRGMGSADFQAVQRGTVQHEVLQGDAASTYARGDELAIKINCASDAGRLSDDIKFALCVSLEVAEGVALPIYQEIATRIRAPARVRV